MFINRETISVSSDAFNQRPIPPVEPERYQPPPVYVPP